MRMRKIRGHKRIWKNIESWKSESLLLDIKSLKLREREYTKIWVHPFSSISISNSRVPEPKHKTRRKILTALFEIYDSWKIQLESLNKPYYLKIWLYEPRFSKSQVVCAIGSSKDFYNKTFYKPEEERKVIMNDFGALYNKVKAYNWEPRFDEEFLNNTDIGELEDFENEKDFIENKKWFESKLKKPHRKIVFKEPIGKRTEAYAFKLGTVWLGEKK